MSGQPRLYGLPSLGDEAEPKALHDWVRNSPGGDRLVDLLALREGLVVAVVELEPQPDGEWRWPLQAVCAAYPPAVIPLAEGSARTVLVLAVPPFVGDLLDWHAEEYQWQSDHGALLPDHGPTFSMAQIAAVAEVVFGSEEHMSSSLYDLAGTLDEVLTGMQP